MPLINRPCLKRSTSNSEGNVLKRPFQVIQLDSSKTHKRKKRKNNNGDNINRKNEKRSCARYLEKENIPLTAPKCELSNTIIILSDSEDENSPQAKKDEDNGLICVNEDKVPLYERDLNCLNSTGILGWLNETVIIYTLNMLKSKYKNRDVYLFSPFFFTRLYQAATNEKERNFKALKNWFHGVDLFNIPLWLIPIFQRHHWFLIAVTNITHKNFHIICMDSLGKDRTKCLELIKIFFEKKYYQEGHTGKWHPPKFLTPKIPLQTNFNDCGLHLIRSAELFLNNKKKTMQMAMGEMSSKNYRRLFHHIPVLNRQQLRYDLLEYTSSIPRKAPK